MQKYCNFANTDETQLEMVNWQIYTLHNYCNIGQVTKDTKTDLRTKTQLEKRLTIKIAVVAFQNNTNTDLEI